jgi:branched-chain amino acid transport system substrate-binding protein
MALYLTDVHAMGLELAQGLVLTTGAYWDLDDASRRFADRFYQAVGRMPTYYQQADYSATLAYLRAAREAGSEDGAKVIAAMKGKPINDFFARGGSIRADGLLIHDVYLAQVKTPAESKRPWDYYKILAIIPGERAFRRLSESECHMEQH